MNQRVNRRKNESANASICQWMIGRLVKLMNGWANYFLNGRTHEGMNAWATDRIDV